MFAARCILDIGILELNQTKSTSTEYYQAHGGTFAVHTPMNLNLLISKAITFEGKLQRQERPRENYKTARKSQRTL